MDTYLQTQGNENYQGNPAQIESKAKLDAVFLRKAALTSGSEVFPSSKVVGR